MTKIVIFYWVVKFLAFFRFLGGEVGGKVGDAFEADKVGVVVFLGFFVCPYHFEGDVSGVAAELEHGSYIAFETVAYHEELVNADTESAAELPILAWSFVGYHLHSVEIVPQSRAEKFVFLVEDFAFSEDHHLVFWSCSEYLKCLFHARERCGGYVEQASSKALYLQETVGADMPMAHLYGIFHQREGERFATVAQFGHVASLYFEKFGGYVCGVGPGCEDLTVLVLHPFEMGLAVPEGVVGVEGDEADGHV